MTGLLSVFVLAASTLAAPSTTPAQCSNVQAQLFQAQEGGGGEGTQSFCSADCGAYAPVSCNGNSCSAVNRSCPEQRGYVQCDGNYFYCPECPTTPECTEGTFKNVVVGPNCGCVEGGTEKERYKCIGGEWVYQYSFCGAPFCPIYP